MALFRLDIFEVVLRIFFDIFILATVVFLLMWVLFHSIRRLLSRKIK